MNTFLHQKARRGLSDTTRSTGNHGPMLGFKSIRSARNVLAGIEFIHMIRKGQFDFDGACALSFADQFYAAAGQLRPV